MRSLLTALALAFAPVAGHAAPITEIRFEGARAPADVARAAEPFIGREADGRTTADLVTQLSAAYAKSGIAFYTVSAPAQGFGGGVVRVALAEGYIERIEAEGFNAAAIRGLATPLLAQRPLGRALLQRQLSLIRALPGTGIAATLRPGAETGGVVLRIVGSGKTGRFSFGIDNRGNSLLGDIQLRGEAKFFGLLPPGDRTDVIAVASPDLDRLRYVTAAHSTPIGSGGARIGASAAYIETRPRRSIVDGDARSLGISFTYPLVLDYRDNVTLAISLDGLNSDSAVFGSIVASDHSRAARVGIGWNRVVANTSFSIGGSMAQGLDILGARTSPLFAETGFRRFAAQAAIERRFGRARLRMRVSGQYSESRLPAVERFTLGGADYGRAFETALLSGDRGVAGLAELAFRPIASDGWRESEVYVFADGGTVTILPRGPFLGGAFGLASAGAGLRLARTGIGRLELETARVIDDPFPGYDGGDWRVSVGWRLDMSKH